MSTEEQDGDSGAVIQPPLLEIDLPDYHGRKADGMKTKLTGAGTRVSRPHAIGDRVVLVIEARAKADGHEETDDGILYVQTLKVLDLFEVQGAPGERLISTLRQAHRAADDRGNGREPFDGLETAGVTDASGNVLTPTELAELRGDPLRSMLDDATTPVVVLYSDNARELWPDDFDAGTPRPAEGERFKIEGEDGPTDYVYVAKLLDVGTGETLAEWTDEQEDARLLELEQEAERSEAEQEAEARRSDEIETKLAETGEAMAEAALDDGLEPLVTGDGSGEALEPLEPPLPGEDTEGDGAEIVRFPGPAAELADELQEPTPDDYAFVDRKLDELLADLPAVGDLAQARRLAEAERRGRGRSLKTRKGALDAILARIDALEKAQ